MAKRSKKSNKSSLEPEMELLTYRQRMFIGYYLGKANGNATAAARMAGYGSPHPEGSRLLRNATIAAAISAQVSAVAISADEVLARLSDMATVSMGDFVVIGEEGQPGLNLTSAKKAGRLHLVKSIKPTKYGLSIEVHDAQSALDKLAKYHRLYDAPDDAEETYDDIPDDEPDVEPRVDPAQEGMPE